jgi:hypothetical protein
MKIGLANTDKQIGTMDAFHVPSILCACSQPLRPGDSVKLLGPIPYTMVELCLPHERHGIVDPFIKSAYIAAYTYVWVMLQPELVGSTLTHSFEIKLTPSIVIPAQSKIYTPDEYDELMRNKAAQEYDSEQERCNREGC